jgi:hypothetical protein
MVRAVGSTPLRGGADGVEGVVAEAVIAPWDGSACADSGAIEACQDPSLPLRRSRIARVQREPG